MTKRYWTLLAICIVVAFACLAYPIYVIRPFRAQGPRELAAALLMLRFRAVITTVCVLTAIAALIWYVRARRRFILATLATVLVCGLAYLSHVNLYELMFHPVGKPSFGPAAASKLDGGEEVIAVNVHGQARAYPVRIISYHHVVNDTVGGVPIVATY